MNVAASLGMIMLVLFAACVLLAAALVVGFMAGLFIGGWAIAGMLGKHGLAVQDKRIVITDADRFAAALYDMLPTLERPSPSELSAHGRMN